jgi:hypothetical protein
MAHRSTEIASRVPRNIPIKGVEVGVRYGKNAAALFRELPLLELWMVDRWEKPPQGDSYYNSGDGIADRPHGHFSKCLHSAVELTREYSDRRHMIQRDSLSAATFLRRTLGPMFDFVFLDADHSYEGVRDDIEAWAPLVKAGGLLCGHDYGHPRIGEVARAVNEAFGSRVALGGDMCWFVRL